MKSTAADVYEAAMTLSPDEQVALATQLLRSAGTEHASRLAALREAVGAGLAQIDQGEGVEVSLDQLRSHIRELGDEASKRAARKTA